MIPLERGEATGLVPKYNLATAQTFTRYPACGKAYWKVYRPDSYGVHARERIKALLAEPSFVFRINLTKIL
ncbi:hypothetical protein DFAR_530008 [Desulfarculales bacterium]